MSYFANKLFPLRALGLFIFPFLAFVLYFNSVSPKPNEQIKPYGSHILAFEFANTNQEMESVLSPLSKEEIIGLDKLNRADFGFMVFYCLFLAGIFGFLRRHISQNWLFLGIPMVLIVLLSDFYENNLLLDISSYYQMNNQIATELLKPLHFITLMKWIGLAVVMFLLAFVLWNKSLWTRIVSFVLAIPILLAAPVFYDSPIWSDRFANSILLCFLILLVLCFFYKIEGNTDTFTVQN